MKEIMTEAQARKLGYIYAGICYPPNKEKEILPAAIWEEQEHGLKTVIVKTEGNTMVFAESTYLLYKARNQALEFIPYLHGRMDTLQKEIDSLQARIEALQKDVDAWDAFCKNREGK